MFRPNPRGSHRTFAILSLLLIFAISDAQYLWRNKACLPSVPRTGIAVFTIGNNGYIAGGATATGDYLGQVWEYNPAANTWTQKNNFPMDIGGIAVFVINDTAYAGIGIDANNNFYNNFWKYNATSDQWTPVANFPGDPRYLGMAFALNGKGYLGCGFNGNLYNDFYQYDPTSNTWTQKADFPGTPRQTGFGAAAGGYGYIGLGWDGNPLTDVYRYDDTSDVWNQVASFAGPARFAPGRFVINDTIYIAGGRFPFPLYDDCWLYDATLNSWVQQQNFSCVSAPMSTTYGFVVNGHGYLAGGDYGDGSYSSQLLEFGPLDMTFVTRIHILGNDTSYCSNFSRVLSTGNPCTLWSTGVTASQITVNSTGTYWAYWPDSCGMVTDTINITQGSPTPFSLGNDTSYCGNFSRTLVTGNPATEWSTGVTAAQITVNTPGTYWATISTCGVVSDTIQILQKPAPGVNLGDDTTLCDGETLLLDATNANSTYRWQDNSDNATLEVSAAGNYSVTVTNASGCSAAGSIVVEQGIPKFSLGNDTSICGNTGIILNVPVADAQFHWQDNSTDSSYHVQSSGTYSVTVTNICGASYGHITINVYDDDCRMNVPTAFSPNGDGKNDFFHAFCQCPVKNFSMRVFNRWGEVVYQTQNFTDKWDGTYQGIAQPMGVFVYLIQYFDQCENGLTNIAGNVTLLR